jgi:hypothetical protein
MTLKISKSLTSVHENGTFAVHEEHTGDFQKSTPIAFISGGKAFNSGSNLLSAHP